MARITERDASLLSNNAVNGLSASQTALAAAAEWDLQPSVFGEAGPVLLLIESRDNPAFVSAQGATGVALQVAPANRRIPAAGGIYIITTGASDGFVSIIRDGAADAVLVATVVGRIAP